MLCHEMRSNSLMHHARVFTNSHHTMRCPCVIKTVIDKSHAMIPFKTKVMFYKSKLFGCHFVNDHFIYKIIVSFVGSGFLESHLQFRTLSTLFLDFHRRSVVNQSESFTLGSVYPFLILPNTSFPFYTTMQLCWTLYNGTEPTHQITNCGVRF